VCADAQRAAAVIGEGAGIRRRHRAHQVVDLGGAPSPVDAAVLRPARAVIAAAREVLQPEDGAAVDEARQAAAQHGFGRVRDAPEHLERRVVGADRHRLLVDDAARIGLGHHLVQRRAGLGVAQQHRPVHGGAAAVLRQQRPMHVVCALGGHGEHRSREHAPVVEGEDEIRRSGAHAPLELARLGICERVQAAPARQLGDAREPHALGRVVGVRDHQAHVDRGVEQHLQAARAYVVVGERDGARQSRFSSTAPTR